MNNICVCCGTDIPEGRQVCPGCNLKECEKNPKRADVIRSMDNKQLAEFICFINNDMLEFGYCGNVCKKCIEEEIDCDVDDMTIIEWWLNQEV